MPELPEVETIKRDLEKVVLKKKIKEVKVEKKKIVRGDAAEFVKELKGGMFVKISRVGKLLIFHLSSGLFLLVHLKMTGQLIFKKKEKITAGGHNISNKDLENLPNKYSRIIFTFADKSRLFFNDIRQFGYMKLASEKEKTAIEKKYGLDPLSSSFTKESFLELLENKKGKIKTFLLNQNLIAGIGNIYADEICFEAKVRPDRKIDNLTKKEKEKIFLLCKLILKKAVKYKGTTFRDFRNAHGKPGGFSKFLKVYQKEKSLCPSCHRAKIEKMKVGGRGTRFCPYCQK
ncbi:MAG: bifunctional DNA-formamidopyrimidine glycosylase/DNA-(apurinic or apyrimidinic site) lyase [Candidatus Pacebacteria bacterium]|nr:bifunctional DNA-formamidopyrimidine glycosylase/DNA-(apurinic or apyrimidinic site) lyase [Candidatus Paceibacterota bacterium]